MCSAHAYTLLLLRLNKFWWYNQRRLFIYVWVICVERLTRAHITITCTRIYNIMCIVCVCVCDIYIYIYIYVYEYDIHIYIYIYISVRVCACVRAYVNSQIYKTWERERERELLARQPMFYLHKALYIFDITYKDCLRHRL